MSYPERGAVYKNRPAWLDRAVEAERRQDAGTRALKDTMDADNRQVNETMPSFPSLKDIQGREALDISDAVPRRGLADGGAMTNNRRP